MPCQLVGQSLLAIDTKFSFGSWSVRSWLSSSHADAVSSRSNHAISRLVHAAQVARIQREFHMLCLARAQVNPGKPTKRPDGSVWRFRQSQIKLDNFIAFPIAGVLDIDFRGKCITGIQRRCGKFQIAIREFRVAQSISERIEWLAFKVTI